MAALFSLNQMQTKAEKNTKGPNMNPTHHPSRDEDLK
jgi:hypothetical protein